MSDAHKHNGNSNDDTKQSPSSHPQNRPVSRAFDLEPNPFEQSFSNTRSSASSSNDDRQHEKDDKSKDMDAKPVLPSVAALSSPTDAYSWTDLAPGSLRSGPLSPAMLQGPQQHHQPNLGSYDPTRAFGRTGLTPSTGLTPLVGPISFPPPSPNTAAFLAMVTNHSNSNSNANPATITPNTFSAITGMLHPSNPSQQGAIAPSVTTTAPTSSAAVSSSIPAGANPGLMSQPYQYSPQNSNGFSAASPSTANAAANGLFLLSQAHQELTKREEAARADANATTRRTSKRKSVDAALPPPLTSSAISKKPRANFTRKRGKSTADEDESGDDEGDLEDMNDKSHSNNRKPETEEEKRRNFLERNRQGKFTNLLLICFFKS